jgi:hemolysin activation/secretion protein
VSINRALPHALRWTTTVSGGTSTGELPTHRHWNLGGWQTVRGVKAGTLRGDAYWMSRAELNWARRGRLQPGVGKDAGWAGARSALSQSDGARLSVGGGVGFFGLPLRLDAARTLEPGSRWRVDFYAPIRF